MDKETSEKVSVSEQEKEEVEPLSQKIPVDVEPLPNPLYCCYKCNDQVLFLLPESEIPEGHVCPKCQTIYGRVDFKHPIVVALPKPVIHPRLKLDRCISLSSGDPKKDEYILSGIDRDRAILTFIKEHNTEGTHNNPSTIGVTLKPLMAGRRGVIRVKQHLPSRWVRP